MHCYDTYVKLLTDISRKRINKIKQKTGYIVSIVLLLNKPIKMCRPATNNFVPAGLADLTCMSQHGSYNGLNK